ncbi:MAG: hypothetical protein KGH53_03790, partial [Candidatus Micrarchaeota archaeon]|nr:hypothetical protein [Candidatus Micrarchaeota archaeon]
MQLAPLKNPFKREDEKNGFKTVIFEGREYDVVRRLGDKKIPEGFFMKADIYKIKRKPEKGKVIKGFAVITEMRSHKEEWNYWVEAIFKSKEDAERLLDAKLVEISKKFGVLDQLKSQISKKAGKR